MGSGATRSSNTAPLVKNDQLEHHHEHWLASFVEGRGKINPDTLAIINDNNNELICVGTSCTQKIS